MVATGKTRNLKGEGGAIHKRMVLVAQIGKGGQMQREKALSAWTEAKVKDSDRIVNTTAGVE